MADLTLTGTPASGAVGVAYTFTPTVTGSAGTNVFSLASGSTLPAGLTLDADTGAITGTPTEAGTSSVTLDVTDGTNTASLPLSLDISAALTVARASEANAAVGARFSLSLVFSGGDGTAVTTTVSGLPDGLTFDNSTGIISGTPTTDGSSTVTVSSEQSGYTATDAFTLTVAKKFLLTGSMPNGAVGEAYTFTPTVDGGDGSTVSYTATNLPGGLSVDATTGTVSGTPTTSGEIDLTITGVQNGVTSNLDDTIEIEAPLALGGTPGKATVGVAYTFTPVVTGGDETSVAYTATDLPDGLDLDAGTGVVSGTPTTEGSDTFSIVATQSDKTVTQTYPIVIGAKLSLTGTPSTASVGTLYAFTPSVAGGDNTAITFSATALPDGLEINTTTGAISGTPTKDGSSAITITAVQSGVTTTLVVSITVTAQLSLSGTAPSATVGVAYTFTPKVSYNGSGTLTYSADNLPPGLSIDSTSGVVSGTPTNGIAGDTTITVTDGKISAHLVTAISVAAPISMVGNPVTAVVGSAYQFIPTISGVNTESVGLTVTVAEGTLPDGLTLASTTGAITGTPTTEGSDTFTLRITDGYTTSETQFTIAVEKRLVVSAEIGTGYVGVDYSDAITVTGVSESDPLTYTVIAGALPAGLELNTADGAITGVVLTEGVYQFTVQVTDGTQIATGVISLQILLSDGSGTESDDLLVFNARMKLYTQNVDSGSAPTPIQLQAAANALIDATVVLNKRCVSDLLTSAMATVVASPDAFKPDTLGLVIPYVLPKLKNMVSSTWSQFYIAAFSTTTPVNAPMIIRDFRRSMLVSFLMKTQAANKATAA